MIICHQKIWNTSTKFYSQLTCSNFMETTEHEVLFFLYSWLVVVAFWLFYGLLYRSQSKEWKKDKDLYSFDDPTWSSVTLWKLESSTWIIQNEKEENFFFFFPENISFKHMSSIGLWSNLESNAYLFLHVARNSVFSTDTFSLFLKPKTGSSVLVNK